MKNVPSAPKKTLQRLLKIGEFEVDRHSLSDVQILLLILAMDPTEKQKQVLDAFEIKIYDVNNKLIYPREPNAVTK
jgi:hypothetical protein